jgi:hypothetical protein
MLNILITTFVELEVEHGTRLLWDFNERLSMQ